jgi:hypothetical protein
VTTEMSTKQRRRLLPSAHTPMYQPMSYALPDPCEACWLDEAWVVPPGLVLVGQSGRRRVVCPHEDRPPRRGIPVEGGVLL